jgi:hypothetical protein
MVHGRLSDDAVIVCLDWAGRAHLTQGTHDAENTWVAPGIR